MLKFQILGQKFDIKTFAAPTLVWCLERPFLWNGPLSENNRVVLSEALGDKTFFIFWSRARLSVSLFGNLDRFEDFFQNLRKILMSRRYLPICSATHVHKQCSEQSSPINSSAVSTWQILSHSLSNALVPGRSQYRLYELDVGTPPSLRRRTVPQDFRWTLC